MDDFNFMSTGQSKPRCEHTEGYADRRNSLIPFNNSKSRQNDQILQSKGVTKIDIKVKIRATSKNIISCQTICTSICLVFEFLNAG